MFKVGDRVECVKKHDFAESGERGFVIDFIVDIEAFDLSYLVEWDNDISGHSGDGKGRYGHCEWVSKEHIKLVEEGLCLK